MDDAHQLLAGVERTEHLLADRLFRNPGDEVLDHREADVSLKQRLLDQPQSVPHVGLGQLAAAAKALQRRGQVFL